MQMIQGMVPPDLCPDPTAIMNWEEDWNCRSCADGGSDT